MRFDARLSTASRGSSFGDSLFCRCLRRRGGQRQEAKFMDSFTNAAGARFIYRAAASKCHSHGIALGKIQARVAREKTRISGLGVGIAQREKEIPEGRYLNLLELRTGDGKVMDDAVNSIMRGVQISDSLPVPDSQMMLSEKMDVNQDGEAHTITLCPGVHPAGSGAASEADFGSISMQRQHYKRQSAANG